MDITVDGRKVVLLGKDDACLICDTKREDMCFSWNMFHGEATSSCCGAVYQIKSYHIDNPTSEQKEHLRLLDDEYIEFMIKLDWVEPLKRAMEELNESRIDNDEVCELAASYQKKEGKEYDK